MRAGVWRPIASVLGLVALVVVAWAWRSRVVSQAPLWADRDLDQPAPLAMWPWPAKSFQRQQIHPGVRRWEGWSPRDGTIVDLLEFDFDARPSLRLALYDQDQDDEVPFDNRSRCADRGVAGVLKHLERTEGGTVVAAWNGSFYNSGADGVASHVAPVVLRGKVHYNVGNHRWTFGVAERDGRPQFHVLHLPDRQALANAFDDAAAGVQCLVKDGQPLRLQPRPQPGDPRLPRPFPSTPADAGHIPGVDHVFVSRTSVGWSADSRKLWCLIVRDNRRDLPMRNSLRRRGGWTVADLQRFWLALGAANAINLDGGPETQMICRLGKIQYLFVMPDKLGWTEPGTLGPARMKPRSDYELDYGGGSLMTFYVRDTREEAP